MFCFSFVFHEYITSFIERLAMKKYLTGLLGLAVCAGIMNQAPKASAYGYNTCSTPFSSDTIRWKSVPPRFRASGVSFSPGVWRDALTESVSQWNTNPSNFYFNLTYDEPSLGTNNGENEIWFTSDNSLLNGSPARALYWYSCNIFNIQLNEVDVVFDVRVSYTPYTNKSSLLGYGGRLRPFQTTASHELGHAAGLLHENRWYNMMGEDWTHIQTNAGIGKTYSGEDASNGAVFLYGLYSSPLNDLSVSHWKYASAAGEYSSHSRTQMFNSSGGLLSGYNDAGEPRYYVQRGQTVQVEFTYENNGTATQNPEVGYYLSTNDNITTLDTFLNSAGFTLGRNTPYTTRNSVTIPSNLAPGKYYVGAIVDRTNGIGEVYENNNSTYIAIQVY
jgi:hypothetical protein